MIHICLFEAKFGHADYVSHKNKAQPIEAVSRNRPFDWGWEWRVMTHECTEEPPSSCSGSNHFFGQLSLTVNILSAAFTFDGILFDCEDRRRSDLMTSTRVSVVCVLHVWIK